MSWPFRFKKWYFFWACLLLTLEVLIALCLHDKVVRPYGGDVLAPIFLYCLVRSGLAVAAKRAAVAVLLTSYLIELLQYAQVLSRLGWHHSRLATVLLGNHFEWADLLAYTIGVALALLVEQAVGARPAARNEWPGAAG